MTRGVLRTVVLAGALLTVLSARAEYEAGQQAWEAGRTDEALIQWQSAAGGGDRRAMHALGRAYVQGLGVLQDYIEAHKWFNLAASRGEAAAAAERDALAEKMTPALVAQAQALARAWRPSESQPMAIADSPVEETLTPTRASTEDAATAEGAADPPETAGASSSAPAPVEEALTPTRTPTAIEEALTPTRTSSDDSAPSSP